MVRTFPKNQTKMSVKKRLKKSIVIKLVCYTCFLETQKKKNNVFMSMEHNCALHFATKHHRFFFYSGERIIYTRAKFRFSDITRWVFTRVCENTRYGYSFAI